VVFLDVNKKAWIVKDLEIPVIENVPMKDLMWFREKIKEASKLKENPHVDESDALKFDEDWWDMTCKIGLDKTSEEIIDTGLTPKEFRELMAEVYHFLMTYGTIEEAKLSVLYDPKIQKNEAEQ